MKEHVRVSGYEEEEEDEDEEEMSECLSKKAILMRSYSKDSSCLLGEAAENKGVSVDSGVVGLAEKGDTHSETERGQVTASQQMQSMRSNTQCDKCTD